jgi:hypothetical protein
MAIQDVDLPARCLRAIIVRQCKEIAMTLFYAAAAVSLVSGIASMGMAVVTAEASKKNLSLAFYLGSVGLVVLSAKIMVIANTPA